MIDQGFLGNLGRLTSTPQSSFHVHALASRYAVLAHALACFFRILNSLLHFRKSFVFQRDRKRRAKAWYSPGVLFLGYYSAGGPRSSMAEAAPPEEEFEDIDGP